MVFIAVLFFFLWFFFRSKSEKRTTDVLGTSLLPQAAALESATAYRVLVMGDGFHSSECRNVLKWQGFFRIEM